jgi:hypothetical protein
MGLYDDFDDDASEQTDGIEAQLEAARAARDEAEKRLAELKTRHAEAGSAPAAGKAAAPGEPDLSELMALVADRSRDWPSVLADLEARGFHSSAPKPSQHGLRGA